MLYFVVINDGTNFNAWLTKNKAHTAQIVLFYFFVVFPFNLLSLSNSKPRDSQSGQ